MGGMIALALVESRQPHYRGGLAFCGMLSTPATFLRRAFDLLSVFGAYVPDVLPPPGKIPQSYKPSEQLMKRVLRALEENAGAAETLRSYASVRSNQDLSGVLVFHTNALRELPERCGGNAFDNNSTLYTAGADSMEVNRRLPRFAAESRADACMNALLAPRGVLAAPFLAVDAGYDPVVPAWSGNGYIERIAGTPAEPWFVRQFVNGTGHCGVPMQSRLDAFADLIMWIGKKGKPEPGLR